MNIAGGAFQQKMAQEMAKELEQAFSEASPEALAAKKPLPVRRHREDKVGQSEHMPPSTTSIMTSNKSAFVVTFCVFLLIVCNTGSYNTGKPRVDLKQEELQRLYAPVVAAHGNRTKLRELAGTSQGVQMWN